MTTSYISITETETDPDAPLTSALAKKWRDNPIAIAEGASGAPKVVGAALNIFLVEGTSTGSGTITLCTATGLDAVNRVGIGYKIRGSATSSGGTWYDASIDIRYSLSTDGGSTWGADTSIDYLATNGANGYNPITHGSFYSVDTTGYNALRIRVVHSTNGTKSSTAQLFAIGG